MITADELTILRKPEVQAYFHEMIGDKTPNDQIICLGFRHPRIMLHRDHDLCTCPGLYYPLVYDTKGTEQGLWGMVDWTLFHREISDSGMMLLYNKEYNKLAHIYPPRLALLKASEWQIERRKS